MDVVVLRVVVVVVCVIVVVVVVVVDVVIVVDVVVVVVVSKLEFKMLSLHDLNMPWKLLQKKFGKCWKSELP